MPCLAIQASRAGISDSGLDTGRVGLPPAKASARLPLSAISRTLGNFAASLRIAANRSGGTRWAWQSTIIQFPFLAFIFSCASAIKSPSFDTFSGSVLMETPSGRSASLMALAIAAGAPR